MKYKVFNSTNEDVKKFVFEWEKTETSSEAVAEAVLYKYGSYMERTVICCSTQSGCPVKCKFCGTGGFFKRNLTADEIVEQIRTVLEEAGISEKEALDIKKFQLMFMSMGEPFLNYGNLEKAIEELAEIYPTAQLLVSTSAPASIKTRFQDFINLSKKYGKVGIQFSVHESTDEARKKLIPTNTSTLKEIAELGESWAIETGRKPFYNYCVHLGNNSEEDATRLTELFKPCVWETTLSVICEKDESVKNSIERQLEIINQFSSEMVNRGASIRVFNPAGQDDIGGGCGQLWYFQKWLKENS